jgi:formyltetrahydrofolate-dependent phosphoribosylglycinamide formyltransferase
MKHLAVFASGRGSNFKAILDHDSLGVLENVHVGLLVTNDAKAPVIQIAREHSVPHAILEGVFGRKFASKQEREVARSEFDERAVETLVEHGIDLVALAGFMQVLGPKIVRAYRYRIMNIHPAKDLARFGGHGMFGERVHAAVLQAGERESGCTVHFVDESVDGGPVILQSTVPTLPGDTPESLAERILIQEHRTYSKAIQLHADERIIVHNGKAFVDWGGGWEEQWNQRQKVFIRHQTRALNQEQLVEFPTRPA